MEPPDTFVIRRAVRADLADVGRLGARLLRVHYDFDNNRFMSPTPDADEGYARFLGSQLKKSDALVLVAERERRIVGYLYAGIEPRNWKELREEAGFVHDILVDDTARGRGAGEALMTAAFDWCVSKGSRGWSCGPRPTTRGPGSCSNASASARR